MSVHVSCCVRYGRLRKEVIFLFERCRGISALEVARAEGLSLAKRSGRHWALCPLHQEKTPSLMLDEKGRWYCFSCHRGGDAVALYAAIRGVSPYQAACALAGNRPAPPPDPNAAQRRQAQLLQQKAEAWYRRAWDAACREREAARQAGRQLPPASPAFYAALARQARAEIQLDALQALSPEERLTQALKTKGETH